MNGNTITAASLGGINLRSCDNLAITSLQVELNAAIYLTNYKLAHFYSSHKQLVAQNIARYLVLRIQHFVSDCKDFVVKNAKYSLLVKCPEQFPPTSPKSFLPQRY